VDAAGGGARRDDRHGAARCGMGVPPRGGLGRADSAVSRDKRSEELEIFVGCRSVDRVVRGKMVDAPVEPVAVLKRARNRAPDFFF
jgi:hypothetical protein